MRLNDEDHLILVRIPSADNSKMLTLFLDKRHPERLTLLSEITTSEGVVVQEIHPSRQEVLALVSGFASWLNLLMVKEDFGQGKSSHGDNGY